MQNGTVQQFLEIREYWQSDEKEAEHEYLKDVLGEKVIYFITLTTLLYCNLKHILNKQALEWVKSMNDHCLQLSGDKLKIAFIHF